MDNQLIISLNQFDSQTNDREIAYIELNNLYLTVESGISELTLWKSNRLRMLVIKAYGLHDPTMINYWEEELGKLPNWLDF